jgi:hypothetical protein
MLGEMIGEFHGKSTGMRVLPGDDYRYIKMEISYAGQGTLLGEPAQDMGTLETFERVPGQTYGTGQGMLFGAGGGVIYNQHGIGRMTGEGMSTHVMFSAACQAPTEGPLARLNGVLLVGEQDIDAEGNMTTRLYEWK